MTGNVLKEIEENIKDYEEQGIEQIPLSLVKYWISVLEKENEQLQKDVARYRGNFREMEDVKCELAEENEQLKQAIAETEKMVQSTYDELTKLRCIKKNLGRIKSQWDWIMEAIQYD